MTTGCGFICKATSFAKHDHSFWDLFLSVLSPSQFASRFSLRTMGERVTRPANYTRIVGERVMLKKIAALAIVVTIVSLSNTARADGWSWSNIFGGQDFYSNGKFQGRSTSNVLGGHNYQNAAGRNIGSSSRNIFGGQNYQFGRTSGYSTPNVFGGSNYNLGGNTGYTTPNVFGGQNYQFGGTSGYTTPNVGGGWNWFGR